MSAKLFGLSLNQLEPSHFAALDRNPEGLWSCSQEFTCRNADYGNSTVSDMLRKGTPITDLNPSIPSLFDFVTLRSLRITHQRGGLTKVRCEFSGASADDGFSNDGIERSISTSFRATIVKKPIMQHPNFIKETNAKERKAIHAAFITNEAWCHYISGTAKDGNLKYKVERKGGRQNMLAELTCDAAVLVDKMIMGHMEYDAPGLEWTINYTNKGGLEDADLIKFGQKVTPPEDPPQPSWFNVKGGWWQFIGATEDKDENSSTHSLTYVMREDDFNDPAGDLSKIYDWK